MRLSIEEIRTQIASYTWAVIPGRRVAHVFGPAAGDPGKLTAIDGQSGDYLARELRLEPREDLHCEQCLIAIVSGVPGGLHKFFIGHVPLDVKRQKRIAWRAYRAARTA